MWHCCDSIYFSSSSAFFFFFYLCSLSLPSSLIFSPTAQVDIPHLSNRPISIIKTCTLSACVWSLNINCIVTKQMWLSSWQTDHVILSLEYCKNSFRRVILRDSDFCSNPSGDYIFNGLPTKVYFDFCMFL